MSTNEDSILNSTKKALGVVEDYDAFDSEITMHINSVLGTLNQLGVGPLDGFEITGVTEKWSDFVAEDLHYAPIKSYVYLRVRMLFDPPVIGFVLTAMKQQIEELEWRINTYREYSTLTPLPEVIGGGTAAGD